MLIGCSLALMALSVILVSASLASAGEQRGTTNHVKPSSGTTEASRGIHAIPSPLPSELAFTLDASESFRRLASIVTGTVSIGGAATTVTMGAGDDANITFDGTAGQYLGLALSNVTIGTSTCCSTLVSVLNPGGSTLKSIQFFGTAGKTLNFPVLPTTGTYTIVIDPQGTDAGSVTLTLSEDVANTISIGGATSSVTMSRIGQNGRVTFSGAAGQYLGLAMSDVTLGPSSCCTSFVSVLKPDGSTLKSISAFGTSGGTINLPVLTVTGTYTIVLDVDAQTTGSVTLTLSEDVVNTIAIGGATSSVTMSRIGQNGRVTFSGTAGQYLGLAMSDVTLGPSTCCTSFVSVLKPDGSTLKSISAFGTSGGTIDLPVLTVTGTYTIVLDVDAQTTGSVTLTLSEDAATTVVINGASASVNMARLGQNGRVAFEGTAATSLVLALTNVTLGTSTCCGGFVSVLNPDGSTLKSITAFGTNGASITLPTLTASGTHTIFLDPNALVTGSVTVTLTTPVGDTSPRTRGVCVGRGAHGRTGTVCTADPVNSLTGAFTTSETDLTLASKGLAFAFTRSYTSADPTVGRLGAGWTDAYAASLTIQPNGDALLHGDEGQQFMYTKQPDGSFVGATGALSKLITVAGGYKLTRDDQVAYSFNSTGVLQSELDRNGQGLSFSYDGSGRLSTVGDASGHTVTFGYSGSSTLLSSVGSTAQNTVTYGYTGGQLASVTLPDPDGPGPLGLPVTRYTYVGGRLETIVDPNTHTQVRNVYDATSGRVTQQTDANDKTTMFAWDAATQTATATDANSHAWKDVYQNNILIQRIDATNKTTTFEHDSSLDVSAVTSPDGASKTTMLYDSAGNLLTATAPASLNSAQRTFTYDAQNNLRTVTDARNKQTVYGYDTAGNENSVTLDGQPVAAATYNAQGQMTSSGDGDGKMVTYSDFDPSTGKPQTVLSPDPDGAGPLFIKTTYTYDSIGNVLTKVDPLGNCTGCTAADYTTRYTYDAEGRLLTETDPLGNVIKHTYDLAGNEISLEDAKHHITTYEYDAANRLAKVTRPDPDGAGGDPAPVATYTYDDVGNRKTEVNPRGNVVGGNPAAFTTTYTYDASNRLASVTTPKSEKTTYTYDANGNRDSMVEPRGNVQGANPNDFKTTYTYDAAGRLLTTTDPLSHVTTNHYDAVGNLDWTKDANQNQTMYSYDAAGRILTVTAPDGGITTYTYDGNGNLKTRKDHNQHTTTYLYDDPGRLTQITGEDPDGTGGPGTAPIATYTYDVNGNALTMVDPNGNATPTAGDGKTTYTYDRYNQLKTLTYSDGTPGVTYNYDAVGNRSSMVDGSGTITYSYDFLDRVKTVTRGTTTFSYTYDVAGNVLTRTYPDATQVTYTYDEDNRLATVASGGNTTNYTYDPASNLTQTTLPSGNGYAETRSYDNAGRLTEVKNAKTNGSNVLGDFIATLDPAGNPTKVVQKQTGAADTTATYGYDQNDRLTGVCYLDSTCPNTNDPFIRWTYDKVGNRLTQARPGGVNTTYTYNGLDQLTQAGTTAYTYDQNGNEKSAGSRTFSYDLANRLKTTTGGGTTTTYTYDGDGVRLQASTGTQASKKTNYVWDTNLELPQVTLERDGNNALLRRYIYGRRLISMRSGTSDYYYHYDGTDSIRNVSSSSGVTQWTETYEPYGNIRLEVKNVTTAPANFMKFAGQYLDPTGLYHLRAREYDAGSGRFTRPDPVGPPLDQPFISSYAYSGDRPTVMADPTGQTFCAFNYGRQWASLSTSPDAGSKRPPSAYRGCGAAIVDGLSFTQGWDVVRGRIFPSHPNYMLYWVSLRSGHLLTWTGRFQVSILPARDLTVGDKPTWLASNYSRIGRDQVMAWYQVKVANGNPVGQTWKVIVEAFSAYPCSKPNPIRDTPRGGTVPRP
jgi:RHS repeat-associated protein